MGGARSYAAGGLAGWLAGTSLIQLIVSIEPILDVNRLGSPLASVLSELTSRAVWVQSNFGPPFFAAAILATWLFRRLRWPWAIVSALLLGVIVALFWMAILANTSFYDERSSFLMFMVSSPAELPWVLAVLGTVLCSGLLTRFLKSHAPDSA